ncbi:MAG: PD-(D/E)XK nuclease family protein [Dehalococcoidia bacterium]|nr:PD-(D/E)XK nuclease family protein [Dehalococcoidia bacterium]
MPEPRLITGDLASIEAALAEAIAAARPAGDGLAPVTVLVGHVLLRPYLARALARRGLAQMNVRYVLPLDLAAELARDALPRDRARLTREAERLLVRETAESAGGYFAAIAGREGFVRALGRLFRELEGGGFTPDGFRTAAQAVEARLPASARKLGELTRLYRLYEQRRAAFVAPADLYRAADASKFEGPLLVYGVWSLPELQARLVERIAERHAITVFLPASGLDADGAHASLRLRFGAAAEATTTAAASAGPPLLARSLLDEEPSASGADGVGMLSAPDTVREVWEAARACLRWAREGIRFHEMALAYRAADTYRPLIDEIFSEAGIATYLHAGRLLAEHPLGRRVLALLALAADGSFPRARVMEFLTETQLPGETLRAQQYASASEWEAFTRDAGIIDGAEQWDARLRRLAEEKRIESRRDGFEWLASHAERIERFRVFAAEFAARLAARPVEATWCGHLAYLRALAADYAAGVEPIIDALDDLQVLERVHAVVPFEVFCRAVRDDLEARDASRVLNEPVREFGRRGVAVLDVTSLRHLRFRAVCLLGVAERAWPPPPRPDPLLLERERRELNAAGSGVLPLKMEPDDEPLQFWLAAQAATERLQVSYARADAGKSGSRVPSFFFRAVVDALEGRRLAFDALDGSAFVQRLAAGRLAAEDAAEAVTLAEYDRTLVHAYVQHGAGFENVRALADERPAFGRAMAARQARGSARLTAFDGCMTGAAAQRAARHRSPFAQGRPVSPSRLEMYAECPYRYFLRYTLGVEPLDEPEAVDRINALERGSLVHAILERFMREVCPDDPPRTDARARHIARLLAIVEEEGAAREQRGVTGKPLIWKMDRRLIHEDLVRWYDREARDASGLVPRAFEAGFGPQWYARNGPEDPLSDEQPLVLSAATDAGPREVLVQGRIDRVDWDDARTRFRVIDYKTGKTKPKMSLDGGKALQLPIYLRAAAQLLGLPAERGEAQYFFVSSAGGFTRPGIHGDASAAADTALAQVLGTIAAGVDDGYFAPNPGDAARHCTYCDYKDVCDARVGPLMQRKAADARAAAFIAMGEIS